MMQKIHFWLISMCAKVCFRKCKTIPAGLNRDMRVCLLFAVLHSWASKMAGDQNSSSSMPTGGGKARINPSDTVFLMLDHQAGLFQTVKDISVSELRADTATLAKLATLLKIPVVTTASEPNGPNGPLIPEIHESASHAVYVPRKGEVNAWDNEDFVNTVRAIGRRTLVMADVWISGCVMFRALDAKAASSELL
jgi:isochorismate hydrolase